MKKPPVDKARKITNTWEPPKCPGCGEQSLVIREIVYSSYDVTAVVSRQLMVGGRPFNKDVKREVFCKNPNCHLLVDKDVFEKEYIVKKK